jgi:hypothetical protein
MSAMHEQLVREYADARLWALITGDDANAQVEHHAWHSARDFGCDVQAEQAGDWAVRLIRTNLYPESTSNARALWIRALREMSYEVRLITISDAARKAAHWICNGGYPATPPERTTKRYRARRKVSPVDSLVSGGA